MDLNNTIIKIRLGRVSICINEKTNNEKGLMERESVLCRDKSKKGALEALMGGSTGPHMRLCRPDREGLLRIPKREATATSFYNVERNLP